MTERLYMYKDLASMDEWMQFLNTDFIAIREAMPMIQNDVISNGFYDTVGECWAAISPNEIDENGRLNWREAAVASGVNSRSRAMVMALQREGLWDALYSRILLFEGTTAFADIIRGRFRHSICSEFFDQEEQEELFFPIPNVDMQKTGFRSEQFDLLISSDVLEHVPFLDLALAESARVLKPGGLFLSSVPFNIMAYETQIKAKLVDGQIEHLTEPEYHGDPINPEEGVLVFQIPGWDILDLAKKTGFREASMKFIFAPAYAIMAEGICGNLVLKLKK